MLLVGLLYRVFQAFLHHQKVQVVHLVRVVLSVLEDPVDLKVRLNPVFLLIQKARLDLVDLVVPCHQLPRNFRAVQDFQHFPAVQDLLDFP